MSYKYRKIKIADKITKDEHRLIMENFLGRKLEFNEVVHHIDGNKINNNLDNLDLCTRVQHNRCHADMEKIVFELFRKGQVVYNRDSKQYFLGCGSSFSS